MDKAAKQKLIDAGIDFESAIQRFLEDEEIYVSCLKKFVKDTSFETMKEQVEQGDVVGAFNAGHALKGVSANLSICAINKELNPLVEVLRKGSMEGVPEGIKRLEVVYNRIIDEINNQCD